MRLLLFTLLIMSTLFVGSCSKEKQPELPPETQTGANTFGCLVDGKVFKPGGFAASLSGGILNCNYQLIDGEYFFRISAADYRDPKNRKSVGLFTESIEIEEGRVYPLEEVKAPFTKQAYAKYINLDPLILYFQSSAVSSGELWIKKFDLEKNIVSGTFWFDAVNEQGQKVQVREGRFDLVFGR